MLLGFKPRFKDPIQMGTKVFTMRGKRKNEPKIGETLYMYCGLRTKNCEKISDKEKLISKQKVRIWIYAVTNYLEVKIWVDGKQLTAAQLSEFVKYDGFVSVRDFADYWIKSSIGKKPTKKGVYRVGGILTLYHWTDLRFCKHETRLIKGDYVILNEYDPTPVNTSALKEIYDSK